MIWLFAGLLVAWGNAKEPLIGATATLPGGSWAFVASGFAVAAVALLVARALGLDAADLGVRMPGALAGAGIGATGGALIALVGVAVLSVLAPLVTGRPVVYEPLARVAGAELARHIAFFLPLGVVIPEEIAFRGALLGALARVSARRAVLGSAAAFALWHAAVAVVTMADTSLGPPSGWFVPAIAGALAVVFAAGLVLARIRLRTRTLASTIAAHWAFNAVVLVGLWYARPLPHVAP